MLLSFAAFKYILSIIFTCHYLKERQNHKLLLQIPFCSFSLVFNWFQSVVLFPWSCMYQQTSGQGNKKRGTKPEHISYLTFSDEKRCVSFHYRECKNGHILSVLKVSVTLQAEGSLQEHFSTALFSLLNRKRSADYGSCKQGLDFIPFVESEIVPFQQKQH